MPDGFTNILAGTAAVERPNAVPRFEDIIFAIGPASMANDSGFSFCPPE